MSRRRELSEEERALWTGVVRSVTPLGGSKKVIQLAKQAQPAFDGTKKRAAVPSSPREAAPQARLPAKTPALVTLGRRLKGRVARGVDPIDARIDLHGHTQKQAHAALSRFLRRAQADGARTVLVVTGKGATRGGGEPSGERGVLKRQVPMWLSLPEFRSFVLGFEDAHVGHGGEGALYVRLRRPRGTDR
jgi:DNA-nicking Smr family endonuclease